MPSTFDLRKSKNEDLRRIYKLSSRADELIRAAARGDRVLLIRNARRETGPEFATRANELGASYGVQLGLNDSKLSLTETGKRGVSAEEAVVFAALDPDGRGAEWLVFGISVSARAKKPLPDTRAKPAAKAPASGRREARG